VPRDADTIVGPPGAVRNHAGSNGSGTRPLPKRRTLPNGRAALGGLLVALSTLVLFSVAQSQGRSDLERYVVASRALALGTRLSAADLRITDLHVPQGDLRRHVFGDVRALVGSVVIAPIAAGELVQTSSIVDGGDAPGWRQIAVPIDPARSFGDRLRAGELVDVVATFGNGADAFTAPVVRSARVVTRETGDGGLGQSKGQLVVLAVTTDDEAIAIAHAVAAGEVSLIRVGAAGPRAEPPSPYRAPRPDNQR